VRTQPPGRTRRLGLAAGLALAATLSTGLGAATAAQADVGLDVALRITAEERYEAGQWAQIHFELYTVDQSSAEGVQLIAALPLDVEVLAVGIRHNDWDCSATHGRQINCVRINDAPGGILDVQLLMEGSGPERHSRFIGQVNTPLADPNPANNKVEHDFVIEAGTSAVQGRVWNDRNGDGLRGGHERGVSGARIRLYFWDGWHNDEIVLVDEIRSRRDGRYTFRQLSRGSYRVEVVAPSSRWDFTTPNAGDEARDSDVIVVDDSASRRVAVSEFVPLNQRESATLDAGLVNRG
jgi:hypothetical protein